MTEKDILDLAKPFLIGIGALVVLNAWSIIQTLWKSRSEKESKTDITLEKLTTAVIKMSFEIEHLQKDINNVGYVVREMRQQWMKIPEK